VSLFFKSFRFGANRQDDAPRIVVTPTPEAVSPTQPTTTRPPVLKGDTSVRTQTETTTEDAPEADDEIIRIEPIW
jgi:hypothetical protein